MNDLSIGIFDSGSGGLTVLDACRKRLPRENFVYASDSLPGGWGSLTEQNIERRAKMCVEKLLDSGCKAVVAACNTATEVAIGNLRNVYPTPFVGVEPAVLPAVRAFPDGKTVVLCTPATARQEKFKALIEKCKARVIVRPQAELAKNIENNLDDLDMFTEFAERIVDVEKPSAVVLGCTHYVYIRYIFEKLLGKERVFDGNDGAARRLTEILRQNDAFASGTADGKVVFCSI